MRGWILVLFVACFAFTTEEVDLLSKEGEEQIIDHRPLKLGEFLRYNIHYGIIDAGEATFSIDDSFRIIKHKKHYGVKVTGRTYKTWDLFYKVRDYYRSYIDSATMLPTIYSRNISEGDFRDKESFFFDRREGEAKGKKQGRDTTIKISEHLQDLASMLYYARSFDFSEKKVGSKIDIDVFFDAQWFSCGVEFVGFETIRTSMGKFRCMKIVPKLVTGRIFKGQNDMVVYISADKNQIPIRVQSEIFVGSIKVDLVEYKNLAFPFDCQIK